MLVLDEKEKKLIVEAILDEHARKVISSTTFKAKSVMEIMREQAIPMTSTYRKVGELLEAGLIEVERSEVTDDGKRYHLYRSKIRSATLSYKDGKLDVDVVPNFTAEDKLARGFFTMKEVR